MYSCGVVYLYIHGVVELWSCGVVELYSGVFIYMGIYTDMMWYSVIVV